MGKTNAAIFGAVGDINMAGHAAQAAQRHGGEWLFERMLPHLRQADVLLGNMESVVLPADYPEEQVDPKGLVSRYDPTKALVHAGFGFLNLAQNHILDAGARGMFHTRDTIEAAGAATGGIGRTQGEARKMRIIEKAGMTFGVLCYAEDSNYSLSTCGPCHAFYTRENVLQDVTRHRDEVDVLVVSIHADLEFMATPSPPRRQIMREAARAGATLVLGHHPHVPQGVERVGDSLVVYSLGNFVFAAHSDSYMREHLPHTGHSFLLMAEVERRRVNGFVRIPFAIPAAPQERPTPLEGLAADGLLRHFDELDAMAADDRVVADNWRRIALERLTGQLELASKSGSDVLLTETLGRLLLVQENRNWVDEVFNVVRENWARQAEISDPLHRPHYVMTNRKRPNT